MSDVTAPFPLGSVVRSKLNALRRRIRAYVWLDGLAASIVWLGIAFWLSLGIDWTFEPPLAVRAIVLVCIGLGLAWVVYRWILRRAFVRLSHGNMAMLLERCFPDFEESLLTLVELAEQDTLDPATGAMLTHTSRQAADPVRGVRLRSVFNPVPLGMSFVAAILLVLGVWAYASAAPEAFAIWSRRSFLLSSELWPRNTRLVVSGFEEGTVKVARGSDFEVIVKADLRWPEVPDVVEIRSRPEGGARVRAAMSRVGTVDPARDTFQEYSYTFQSVLVPICFDVAGGDAIVRNLTIEVVDNPTLIEARLECRLPEYTGLPPRTVEAAGVTQLPAGTSITVSAKANKNLVRVEIDDGTARHIDTHESLALVEKIRLQQDQIRRGTTAGDGTRFLADFQKSLAGHVATLAEFARDAESIEPGAASMKILPSRAPGHLPAFDHLESARRRMLQAREHLLADDRPAADAEQEAVLRQLHQAEARLEAIFHFRQFSHEVPDLSEDTTLLLTLFDTDGIESRVPVRIALAALADRPPELAVGLRGIGPAITPKARIPVAGRVSDDYGVRRVWFDCAVEDREPVTRPVVSPPGNPTEVALAQSLEVADLAVTPGQKLVVSVKASDGYDLGSEPNVGTSERWLLDVVTPERLRILLEARELVLRQRFERIIQEVTETRESLARITFNPPENAEEEAPEKPSNAEPPARSLALEVLRVQRAGQNGRKSTHETLGLAEAFFDISDELTNNRIDTPELTARLQSGIANPLRQIAEVMFPELDRRLARLEQALSDERVAPETREEAIEQVDAILAAMNRVLRRILELEDFNKAIELLREIIDDQENLGEKVIQRRKQKLRELLED